MSNTNFELHNHSCEHKYHKSWGMLVLTAFISTQKYKTFSMLMANTGKNVQKALSLILPVFT
jgi:hypothetical protein